MPILDSLTKPHEEIKNKRKEAYEKILKQCHNHMNMLSKYRRVDCTFIIPRIIFEGGYPPINYDECFHFLETELNTEGIDVLRLSPNEMFISWADAVENKLNK